MNKYLFIIFCFILIDFASGKEFEKSAKVYMYDPLANNLATNIKIFRSLKQIKKLRFDLIIFATFHNIFSKEIISCFFCFFF